MLLHLITTSLSKLRQKLRQKIRQKVNYFEWRKRHRKQNQHPSCFNVLRKMKVHIVQTMSHSYVCWSAMWLCEISEQSWGLRLPNPTSWVIIMCTCICNYCLVHMPATVKVTKLSNSLEIVLEKTHHSRAVRRIHHRTT